MNIISTGNTSFFYSESGMIMFALLYTDGKVRSDIIGLTIEVYDSVENAKEWYNTIMYIINKADMYTLNKYCNLDDLESYKRESIHVLNSIYDNILSIYTIKPFTIKGE